MYQMTPEDHAQAAYTRALADFGRAIADADHKIVWLIFYIDARSPGATARYGLDRRGVNHLRIPIPSGVYEHEVRSLVLGLLRDGFRYKEFQRESISHGGFGR
jgi:hypothetical protein